MDTDSHRSGLSFSICVHRCPSVAPKALWQLTGRTVYYPIPAIRWTRGRRGGRARTPLLTMVSIAFRPCEGDLQDMDILLVGPVLAISMAATLLTGKFMLRGFVAVLERR